MKEISIIIPGWIKDDISVELYEHIKSLCHLVSDDEIRVQYLEPKSDGGPE